MGVGAGRDEGHGHEQRDEDLPAHDHGIGLVEPAEPEDIEHGEPEKDDSGGQLAHHGEHDRPAVEGGHPDRKPVTRPNP